MLEKTPVNNKRIILLRLILPCLLVAVLLFPVLVVPARAEMIDYNDYVTDVQVDGENDLVTVRIPAEMSYVYVFKRVIENGTSDWVSVSQGLGGKLSYNFEDNVEYRVTVYPLGHRNGYNGLLLKYIPVGTTIYSGFGFDMEGYWGVTNTPRLQVNYYYLTDGSSKYVHVDTYNLGMSADWPFFTDSYTIDSYDNSDLLDIEFYGTGFYFEGQKLTKVFVEDTLMVFSISSLLRQQQLTGKTNALLKEVELQLAEQGKTLDDIRDQMEETNDKLDKLPGEIGDEMQGVIDKEEQEAESSGNKFVDQILDALPDPSTQVLGALKGLTDATSYTGTKATLTIPAIVLPGIGDLFPTTEIWGGAEFDFGEYIEYLPSTLLTLVRSLFTIAIVLYCVYELKGIISYCLTLRSNKGE